MQKNKYFPMALIAIAVLSGCTTTPPQNTQLSAAHSNYNDARSNPQVANLAALELKDAGDTLDKADTALSKGQSLATVDHLAYLASQKVGIAQETARQKTAELAVTNAAAKRNEVRLAKRGQLKLIRPSSRSRWSTKWPISRQPIWQRLTQMPSVTRHSLPNSSSNSRNSTPEKRIAWHGHYTG